MRVLGLLGFVLLGAHSQAQPQDTCSSVTYDVRESAVLHFRCMVIGEIVGAQFVKDSNHFFLYATQPEGVNESTLWTDEVAELALASLNVGPDYGFSLDFERNGTSEF